MSCDDVLIFTALPMEAAAIIRALRPAGRQTVVVKPVGLRACRLLEVTSQMNSRCVIIAGLAGGLDPALQIGDVVMDSLDMPSLPSGARRGRIHTSTSIVQSVEQKADLFRTTGAAAVDMEQAIIARWAVERGARVIGLRAISDTAADALDPVLLTLVDARGRPRPRVIATALLRNPMRILQLLRLARRSRFALKRLSTATVELVRSLD